MQVWRDILKRGGQLPGRAARTGLTALRSIITWLRRHSVKTSKRFNRWYQKRPREFTIKIRWVIVFIALLHILSPHKPIYAEPGSVAPAPEVANLKHFQPVSDNKYPEQSQAQVKIVPTPTGAYSGSHEDWMAAAGIDPSDYQYVDYIVSREGGWNPHAYNPSGAYGVCQSLPGSKMASAGDDWQDNPVTQLKWCNSYAQHYGGWYESYLFWIAHSWW